MQKRKLFVELFWTIDIFSDEINNLLNAFSLSNYFTPLWQFDDHKFIFYQKLYLKNILKLVLLIPSTKNFIHCSKYEQHLLAPKASFCSQDLTISMKLPKKFFSSKKAYQITISNFDDFRETNSENKEHFIISTFKIGILLTLNYGNNKVLY